MAKQDRIPDWLLERIALDEVPAPHREEAARVTADPQGAEQLAALRRSDAEILAAYPVDETVREIERRHHLALVARAQQARRVTVRRWSMAGTAMAASAAAVFLIIGVGPDPVNNRPLAVAPETDVVRSKGDPQLSIHRKRGNESEPLAANQIVRAGDLLQLSYRADGSKHGIVLSIDGAGVVTLHHPEQPGGDTVLEAKGPVQLPHAYELDDAPAFERFWFVTSAVPIDVEAVLENARRLAKDPKRARLEALDLPPNAVDAGSSMKQKSILLIKNGDTDTP